MTWRTVMNRIKCRYLGHPNCSGGRCDRCGRRIWVSDFCGCCFDGFAGVDIDSSCPEHGEWRFVPGVGQ